MTIFMETTAIAPERTIGEIQKILVQAGAKQILMEYEEKEVAAVCFMLDVNGNLVPFRLPCRWQSILKMLAERRRDYKQGWGGQREEIKKSLEPQARRVAWRQILRWVEAQMAIVETQMVKLAEVFLPYAQMPDGRTVYEHLENRKFMMLDYKAP
jgi:hypothetical protein